MNLNIGSILVICQELYEKDFDLMKLSEQKSRLCTI